jgi:hypothetical protein
MIHVVRYDCNHALAVEVRSRGELFDGSGESIVEMRFAGQANQRAVGFSERLLDFCASPVKPVWVFALEE